MTVTAFGYEGKSYKGRIVAEQHRESTWDRYVIAPTDVALEGEPPFDQKVKGVKGAVAIVASFDIIPIWTRNWQARTSEAEPKEESSRTAAAAQSWAKNWQNLVTGSKGQGHGQGILHGHFPALTEEESRQSLEELLEGDHHQYHTDLRLEAPSGGAWGFTCFEGRSGKVGPKGSRLYDMDANKPMRGLFKLEMPHEWLTYAKGGPKITEHIGRTGKERSKFFALDWFKWKLTFAREHSFEIIITDSAHGLKGRYQINYVPVIGGSSSGKFRMWQISRPANQDTTYPQEHPLESTIRELRRKGQKWLFWRDDPNKPLQKIDVTGKTIGK